jgi:hypothetical protein
MIALAYVMFHYHLAFACAGTSYEPFIPALLEGRCEAILVEEI